jgi:hypothetical protein
LIVPNDVFALRNSFLEYGGHSFRGGFQ